MIFEFNGISPKIGKNVYIAKTATVIGDVKIKDGASIWYGTVLRGDMAPITVGEGTNIQDNCTVHTDYDKPAIIGNNVTIGHNAVVHGCIIENNCLIGINSVVLSNAHVKTGSVVAAGSVVKYGQIVGPYHLVAGIPALRKKTLSEHSLAKRKQTAAHYVQLAAAHKKMKKADA
ncbi:MAG: gamma carbonic anhydrase family protein [Desulfobacterales bacterium]|nr:MAG: gamma carbonic anhydrase family protein [Desulfobacterales bacterium]